MCEVTIDNFKDVYKDIENSINQAKFIAIDTEFSALNITDRLQNSLFDSPEDRYRKLKDLCDQIIPMQIGISAFVFNADKNSYLSHTFTFYTLPRCLFQLNPTFICQSASLQFLCNYKFDFNKFAYKGISFINRKEESDIQEFLNRKSYSHINIVNSDELDNLVEDSKCDITNFLTNSKLGDTYILRNIHLGLDGGYLFHKAIREKFNKEIWSFESENQFLIKRVTSNEYDTLKKNCKLDVELMDNMLGFTKVFRLLCKSQKPIIGHNLLTDLMLIYKSCENPLPKSYLKFKKDINAIFPTIFDTKSISFTIRKSIPDNKMWLQNSLAHLYLYFKDGDGRHLAFNSPLIQVSNPNSRDSFHNAGWDSYCTGYIFIRMAHILASEKYVDTKFKTVMSSELLAATSHLKNKLNLIRCSVSHINLNGDDPPSTRPAYLMVQCIRKKPVDIIKVTDLLCNYGFVEVKPYGTRRAIVAVDNFGSAKRILTQFKKHNDFNITTYSAIKHSPIVRAVMWGGVIASGAILMWVATNLKK